MDNLTHTLSGLALARILPRRPGQTGTSPLAPYGTAALVVAANLPDIDLAGYFGGAEFFLRSYRTATHSLVGAVLLAVVLASVFWLLARRRHPRPHLLRNLALLCCLGTLAHVALDALTAYGAQLLWPFRTRWLALDWFPFLDTWLLVLLLLGLLLPEIFRLVSEEIGARRGEGGRRAGAALALAGLVLLAAGRGLLHGDAEETLRARLYDGRAPVRVAAFPSPLSPGSWRGVVETRTTFETLELSLLPSALPRPRRTTFRKPEPSPILDAARATPTAALFLAWARFPYVEILPWRDGWQVRMRDLRAVGAALGPGDVAARIELTKDLRVVRAELRFTDLEQKTED